MRFPSVVDAARKAEATAARFPLALFSGAVACGALMSMIAGPDGSWKPRLFATAALGLPLFVALAVTVERRAVPSRRRWLPGAVLAPTLALLFVASLGWTDRLATLRFLQLLLVGHLAAAALPYLGGGSLAGFWQYNRLLFVNVLLASIYTVVLWGGLAVALVAIDQLFAVQVPEKAYPHLMALLGFIFHPWFFLAQIPSDLDALDTLDDYPIGLKVFAQFVLVPLVTVYLAILTAYLGRVVITRTWPSGWIGWLVSSVSVAGVLALLLVHPIRDRADSRWVNRYGRWFFVALLPSLGMLLVAIGKRIGQYGITEPRYFLLVLALWLLALACFYGITASRNIKWIPASLCGVALLTALGPWGAYAVSRRSQLARLDGILTANGMGRLGTMTAPAGAVSFEDRKELSAILSYLRSGHGPVTLAVAVGMPRDSALAWTSDTALRERATLETLALRRVGLEYVRPGTGMRDGRTFTLTAADGRMVEIAGFDLLRAIRLNRGTPVTLDSDSLTLVPSADLGSVAVRQDGTTLFTLDLAASVDPAIDRLAAGTWQGDREDPVQVEGAAAGLTIRLLLRQVSGYREGDSTVVNWASGYVLLRRNRPDSAQ